MSRHIEVTLAKKGSAYFEDMNFVQGFERPGCWSLVEDGLFSFDFETVGGSHHQELFSKIFGKSDPKWKPPVSGETMGILTYQSYAQKHFAAEKRSGHAVFEKYYTGGQVPSWEDNDGHSFGIWKLSSMVSASRAAGLDPITMTYPLEPRVAFDHRALTKMASDGFRYFAPMDIKYATFLEVFKTFFDISMNFWNGMS